MRKYNSIPTAFSKILRVMMASLPIWECLHRIRVLNKFNSYIITYDENSTEQPKMRGSTDSSIETSIETRKSINLMTPKISKYLLEAGQYPIIYNRDPPAIGGRTTKFELIQNIFNLDNFDLPLQDVVDSIYKAIGYYQDDKLNSFFRTINPIWWIWKLIILIIRIPFQIIDWAGYDSNKLEKSSGGKLYKVIAGLCGFLVALVTLIAGIVQILDSFDLIQPLKNLFDNWIL